MKDRSHQKCSGVQTFYTVSFDEMRGDRDLINAMLLCKILDHQSNEKFV
jgi:hypothetical protein